MFPGDPDGTAAEVVNCRCTLLQRARWALGEDELQTLKERAKYFGLDKSEGFEDFKKKYIDVSTNEEYNDEYGMHRKRKNTGVFSHLQERMSKKHIRETAKQVGIDLKGITLNIDKNAELLSIPFAGRADSENVGGITFFPNAFISKEELIRTIIHEKIHVQQFKKYGVDFVQNNRSFFEDEAYKMENEFIDNLIKRGYF